MQNPSYTTLTDVALFDILWGLTPAWNRTMTTDSTTNTLLTENDVVEAVCRHLEANGMAIISRCSTKEQGYDIVARYPDTNRRLIVEAKGATSARADSARFEQGFSRNQIRSHVARAFYSAAAALQRENGNADAAITFPDTSNHRRFVDAIARSLDVLGIKVFWVQEDGNVSHE